MPGDGDVEEEGERRVFGAGLKRRRIDFVPATGSAGSSADLSVPTPLESSLGERYLAITLKDDRSQGSSATMADSQQNIPEESSEVWNVHPICDICQLSIVRTDESAMISSQTHSTSLAHQVCLEHSYPPSHLDRNRQGLKYLASYGWDPDSRLGLGAGGTGIRVPIKARPKHDTVGLGVKVPETRKVEKKTERLDAKGMKKRDLEERRRRERLQQLFYASEDVERYLGGE